MLFNRLNEKYQMNKNVIVTTLSFFLFTVSVCAKGFLTHIGPDNVPLVIVQGSAYEMGHSIGTLVAKDIAQLVNTTLPLVKQNENGRYCEENLDSAWKAVSPHLSKQWTDQLLGLAAGSGLSYRDIIRFHMIPVLGNYSCSGAVLWGEATKDNKMYVFRNLDYSLDMRMQDFPLIVVYLPDDGLPHVNPTFAGFIGVQTGINASGVALTEMGDSPGRDYLFDLNGIPFIALFSDLLYRSSNMDMALKMIEQAKRIKKYHYVIGSASDNRGAKIKAHATKLEIWQDNDPKDEYAPDNIFKHIVINAESRAPIAFEHIRANYGKYSLNSVIELTKSVPIKGGNLLAVVYNASELQMHFTYAKDRIEAYKRDFISLDLKSCFDYEKAQTTFKVDKKKK